VRAPMSFLPMRIFRQYFAGSASSAATGKFEQSLPVSFERPRPLAFLHIPKTSGNAVASGLMKALSPNSVVTGLDHCLFGPFKNFCSIDVAIRSSIYGSAASLPKNADLVVGHFALSTLAESYPTAQFLTVLREPFSRLLSHWMYWRQHNDGVLSAWGDWADRVRGARKPLADFLNDPMLASTTDNLMLRMLLWPHPLLPIDQFIDPCNDERLIRDAMERLLEFDFVDIVENDSFVHRLNCWLGLPFDYNRHNETKTIPPQYRTPLHHELTAEAHELLEARSRLDLRLWTRIAADRLPDRSVSALRERTVLANVARYGVLIAG
jgi:hypothetical protein